MMMVWMDSSFPDRSAGYDDGFGYVAEQLEAVARA